MGKPPPNSREIGIWSSRPRLGPAVPSYHLLLATRLSTGISVGNCRGHRGLGFCFFLFFFFCHLWESYSSVFLSYLEKQVRGEIWSQC